MVTIEGLCVPKDTHPNLRNIAMVGKGWSTYKDGRYYVDKSISKIDTKYWTKVGPSELSTWNTIDNP